MPAPARTAGNRVLQCPRPSGGPPAASAHLSEGHPKVSASQAPLSRSVNNARGPGRRSAKDDFFTSRCGCENPTVAVTDRNGGDEPHPASTSRVPTGSPAGRGGVHSGRGAGAAPFGCRGRGVSSPMWPAPCSLAETIGNRHRAGLVAHEPGLVELLQQRGAAPQLRSIRRLSSGLRPRSRRSAPVVQSRRRGCSFASFLSRRSSRGLASTEPAGVLARARYCPAS